MASVYTAGIKRSVSNTTQTKYRDIKDRVMKVTGYDLEAGKIYGEDLSTNQKYEAYVDPVKKASAEAAILAKDKTQVKSNATWMGHAINKQMEKANPVNDKKPSFVVLVKGEIKHRDATRGGVAIVECEKIGGVPASKPNKVIQGNIVVKYKLDKETGCKVIYQAKAYDPHGYDLTEENIEKIAKRIDESRANYGKKIGEFLVSEPTVGVQFRVMKKKTTVVNGETVLEQNQYAKEGQPKDVWETVEKSSLIDWMPGPKGPDGKEIKSEAHTLTGDEFKEYVTGMLEHIGNSEKFKEGIDSGDIEIDLQVFRSLPVSQNDSSKLTKNDPVKDKYADKNPLYQLSHGKSYCSEDHDTQGLLVGENYAVRGGILLITDDKWTDDEPPQRVSSNWVSRIYANNIRQHIDKMTPRENGAKVTVHPSLDIEKTVANTNTNKAAPAPAPTPVAAPAPELSQESSFDPDIIGDDPFGGELDDNSVKSGMKFGSR
jgi:hypothetical protein